MSFNQLLEKQLHEFLPGPCPCKEDIARFVRAVNTSYNTFEKDMLLSVKESQYRLSTTTNRLSQLITNLNNGILVEDENRKILLANQLFCDMFSVPAPPDHLIGLDCSGSAEQSKHLCKDPDAFVARIHKLLADKQLVTGDELELVDGRVLVRDYVPIRIENDYKGHLWTYKDITEERYYQKELQRLALVASANENGVTFCGPDGVISWANEGFLKLTGYSMEDLEGKTPVELCKGPLSDRPVLRGLADDFANGRNFDAEVIHYRKDGSWFWGRAKGQAILDDGGKLIQYFAIIEDITQRKNAEAALIEARESAVESSQAKEIFFANINSTVARRYGGTGLGMSISKQLVELMDGHIQAFSEKGKGTEIVLSISFGVGREADLPAKVESPADAIILKGKRILLVEDNEVNRFLANTILTNYGAVVSEVVNGIEAVGALKTHSYDIVLMDVQMPVMDGREATRLIRREVDQKIPIIALTANALKGEMDLCLAAGMNDYVSKPFEEDDLVKKICRYPPPWMK